MELILTTQDLETLPEPKILVKRSIPSGILNSDYKNIVRNNFSNTASQSLFSIKQRLKSRQYQFTSAVETALKVSIFAIIVITIFF